MKTGESDWPGLSAAFDLMKFARGIFLLWIPRITFLGVLFCVSPAYANVGNPSFESGIGSGTEGNWDASNGSTRIVTPPAGFDAFPNGSAALLQDATTDFTFQTTQGVVEPGDLVVFSVRAESNIVTDGTSGGQLRIEFQGYNPATNEVFLISDVTSALITVDNAPRLIDGGSGAYTLFTISGRAPDNVNRVTFTLRRQGAGAGNVVFDDVTAEINPTKLNVSASKTSVKPGDVVTVIADFVNTSAQNQTDVVLNVEIPAGLDILPATVRNNGGPAPIREGSLLIVSNSTVRPGDTIQIVFQVLVTPGVSLGKAYEISAIIQGTTAQAQGRFSEVRRVALRIKGDPLFDEGTILGKVFDDRNEDGLQQKGEIGVGGVRLYTEYGVSVVTDGDGRFHIPAVQPGRHVVKIDGHTLPEGTRFLTEESLLIKTTPGLLNKIRFAVLLPESALPEEFKKDLQVWVTQGADLTLPELRVLLIPETLKAGMGRLEREPVFKIKTNYGEYITGWRLVVMNEIGEKIWTGLGIGEPPTEIPWNGLLDNGEMIGAGTYAYRLIARDAEDHEDWTPLHFFHVLRKAETFETGEKPMDISGTGAFNIFRDGRRGIPLVAKPMVRVYGKTQPGRTVTIGAMPVEVGPTGEFEQEFFVKPGEKNIRVSAAAPEGDTVSVEEKMTVKDSSFFLVALGEEEMGVNFRNGNFETSGRDDEFHEGFYQEGRLSYYLKGKIKGRFLVKSRYDTSDKRSELFTSLDPDSYYPVYGDQSQIEYEGQETRERFFILVEMDRSFLKWGSFNTDFTDTELSRYNRTLSGLKVHQETLAGTKYGDPRRGFTLYYSKPNYLADHNEFRGTGGSLYYLRNRNLLPGSEKLRLEVRDKITDIPVETRDLVLGRDYEIDYPQGRILLREPLSSVASSQTIISNDILDGNPTYLIADYEFETFQMFEDTVAGIRGYAHIGEHVRFGGTAIEEQRQNADYDLRGIDGVIRTGRNTKIVMEIAQSKLQQVRQGTSFNGGLSFHSQSPFGVRRPRETAYLIKAESKPVEALEMSGYIQNIQPGFSIDRIASQEGFRKYGLQARLKLSRSFYLLGRHDTMDLASQVRPLAGRSIFAALEQFRSSTAQAVFDQGPWKVIAEYLNQHLDMPPPANRIDSLLSEMPFRNAVGAKVGRRVSDWLMPYLKAQYAFAGHNNLQMGGGLEAKFREQTKVYYEQMFGSAGDAVAVGISHNQDEKRTSYATIKVRDTGLGRRGVSTSVGSSHQLSERSRVYSEREYSTYSGNLPLSLTPSFFDGAASPGIWSSDIYGYESQFWDRWTAGARFERRHLDSSDFRNLADEALSDLLRTNTFNTLALNLGYIDAKRIKGSSSVEVRIEPDAPEIRQWVTQNSFEWQVNRDLSFLGRANFGTSRFTKADDLTGRFVEFNTGFAYRPIESDRLNWLARYTFFSEEANDAQFIGTNSGTVEVDERAHVFAVEGGYELNRYLQTIEKAAFRLGEFNAGGADWVHISTLLLIHRFNFHITRKWDLGLEYRIMIQAADANNYRHGPLIEIDREFYDYIRLGIGYNFTDFDDDLRRVNDFRKSSLFFRMSGKV